MPEKVFINCSSSERSINTPGLSTVAVKYVSCLAQEHNTMTPGWAQTQASFQHMHTKLGNCEEELLSTDCQPSVGRQATDRPLAGYRQMTDSFPKQTFYCKIEQKKPE